MSILSRRALLRGITAATALLAGLSSYTAFAQDRTSVKIGYAISKTGGNAGGAGITTIPNYELWVHEVNEAGGLELPDGTHLPIETIVYDDRSQTEEVVRGIERLATQDKVDFILSPWGTGFNLAVAPLFDRFGYPHLANSAVTDKADEFVARWKRSFWMLGGGADYASAIVDILSKARDEGKIGADVAVISVADGFGIDLITAARPLFKEAGFNLVYDRAYPPTTTDFSPLINEASATGADSFIAFSYPPDSFALTQQAQVANYNPSAFLLGVGAPFPSYLAANGKNTEGVLSLGGINPSSEAELDYRARHKAFHGVDADYWASLPTYISLQLLQEAIKRQGLDRDAVANEIATGTFPTVLGDIKMENNQFRNLWWIGQWQDGVFVAVEPSTNEGASTVTLPKPAWNAAP